MNIELDTQTLNDVVNASMLSLEIAARRHVGEEHVLGVERDGDWAVMRLGKGKQTNVTVRFRAKDDATVDLLRSNFVGWQVVDMTPLPCSAGWGFRWLLIKMPENEGDNIESKSFDATPGERQSDGEWDVTIRSAINTLRIGHDRMPHFWMEVIEDNEEELGDA